MKDKDDMIEDLKVGVKRYDAKFLSDESCCMSKLAIAKVKATVEIRLMKTKARDFRRLTATGRNEEAERRRDEERESASS